MIEGRVTRSGQPVITLTINGHRYRALIDTGFNGDLELPSELKAGLNARYIGSITSTLAGGVSIREDVFLVDFSFDDEVLLVEATFVDDDEMLIGTRLLSRHRLEITSFDEGYGSVAHAESPPAAIRRSSLNVPCRQGCLGRLL